MSVTEVSQELRTSVAAQRRLDAVGLKIQGILFAVDTDVNLDGWNQRQWLVATAECLWLIGGATRIRDTRGGANHRQRRRFRFGRVGSGLLQVPVKGQWLDVLRYSNSVS